MSIFKSKTRTTPTPLKLAEPTLAQQLNATHAQASAALSFFEAAAADLYEAALKQDAIAGLIYDEIEALEEKAREAVSASVDNLGAHARIRELVGSIA